MASPFMTFNIILDAFFAAIEDCFAAGTSHGRLRFATAIALNTFSGYRVHPLLPALIILVVVSGRSHVDVLLDDG